MPDAEFTRFQRKVRSGVRAYVREQREAPPLSLWCSEGENPRRVARVPVGAARDAQGVREYIVAGIKDRRAAFAAIGRLLHVPLEAVGGEARELVATSMFAVVFVSRAEIAQVVASIEAGGVGFWREAEVVSAEAGSPVNDWFFVQQAIRGAAKGEVS